jgi:hypothetical protein
LASASRGSGVIDPTRTGTNPVSVQRLRDQFSGSGVAGYHVLSALLGKSLASLVPETQPPIGYHATPAGIAMNVIGLLPPSRAARYGLTYGLRGAQWIKPEERGVLMRTLPELLARARLSRSS